MKSAPLTSNAAAQIAQSRAEMARWLAQSAAEPPSVQQTLSAPFPPIQTQLVSLALASLSQAWLGKAAPKSPPMAPAELLSQTAEQLLSPLSRRHPWALVGAATLVGGALVYAKPWRWLMRADVMGALAAQLVTRVLANSTANAIPDAAPGLSPAQPPF